MPTTFVTMTFTGLIADSTVRSIRARRALAVCALLVGAFVGGLLARFARHATPLWVAVAVLLHCRRLVRGRAAEPPRGPMSLVATTGLTDDTEMRSGHHVQPRRRRRSCGCGSCRQHQETVATLRALMKQYAPDAREDIAYNIPVWRRNGILAVISPEQGPRHDVVLPRRRFPRQPRKAPGRRQADPAPQVQEGVRHRPGRAARLRRPGGRAGQSARRASPPLRWSPAHSTSRRRRRSRARRNRIRYRPTTRVGRSGRRTGPR